MNQRRAFWPHQKKMFEYTRREANPALFVEMRLGKTLVAIRRIKTYRPLGAGLFKRILIVCPMAVIQTWEAEIRRECPQDAVVVLRGKNAFGALQDAYNGRYNAWCIINKEGHRRLPDIARPVWDAVVLDESTFIKNPKAKMTRFYCEKIKAAHRWILTGTPAPEGLLDYFQQLRFLDGRFLGERNYWVFRDRFFEQDGFDWFPMKGVRDRIATRVAERAFTLSRKQAGVFCKKVYEERFLEMPATIRKKYEDCESFFEFKDDEGLEEQYDYSVQVINRLRRLASGWIGDRLEWDGKIKEIDYLASGPLEGGQFLVWCYYLDNLKEVLKRLRGLGYRGEALYGAVPEIKRRKIFRAFNGGGLDFLCIQPAVGAYGIDLSRASASIYYDGVQKGLERTQSEDRIIHPLKKEASLIVDLLSEKTIDEDIFNLIVKKQQASATLQRLAFEIQERRLRNAVSTIPF